MYFVYMLLLDEETGIGAEIGDVITKGEFDRLTKRSKGIKPYYTYNNKSYQVQSMWAVGMEKVI